MQALEAGLGQQPQALLGVGAVEADDQRHVHVDPLVGLDDALGDLVAAGDPAEDVEQHGVDLLVGGDHLERVDDRLGLGAAAGVEEVGGLAAGLGDDVEGRHAEPGAVAEDADVAVELDVGQALLLGHPLLRILGLGPSTRRSSSWRKSAELSIVTLASSATTSRSEVTISGLTSIRVASLC